MPAPSGDRVIGRLLDGRYDVRSRIARGGMATVYQALDTRLDRTVAVKVMHQHLADDADFAARFVREARAAARLNHAGVVGVFDQGEDDGLVYLAMEYVPGRTLRDVVSDEAPLPPLRTVRLVEHVLDALAAAHAAKIVHRDVKPENVLLTPGGAVKVADFGLARAISTDSTATATGGLLIGTVSYLAPELVLGETADARSDVYAVGIVLYELLTGRKPHQGETPIQVAYKHVNDDVPPPSAAAGDLDWHVPDFVDALVARATVRDPALRPTDAGVLLRQLRRVRSALEHGVHDDPELADDLRPRPGRTQDDDHEDTLPDPLLTPAPADAPVPAPPADGHEHTLVVGALAGEQAAAQASPPTHEPATVAATVADAAAPGGPASPWAERGAPAPPNRRRRRGLWWLVVVLLLALLAGLGGWWYGVGRFTETPRLISLTESAARDRAAEAGLEVEIGDTVYSEEVPAGSVVATDPEPGERILGDGTVTLTLSQGKERYPVPDLAGLTVDEAEARLADDGLTLGDQEQRWSERYDEGQVVATVKSVGTMLKPDTAVDVVVSRGPRPIDIDDFTGQPLSEAKDALSALGFEVRVVGREFSDDVPQGSVLSQDPSGGTGVRGDRIELVASKGPELVEVPDLTGQDAADAVEQLEALGFTASTQPSDFYIGLDRVARQSESPGAMLPRGTEIVLYLV